VFIIFNSGTFPPFPSESPATGISSFSPLPHQLAATISSTALAFGRRSPSMRQASCGFAPRERKRNLSQLCNKNGSSFKLDAAGNTKAARLIQETGKKDPATVVITGETRKDTIKVDSISTEG
jgi:hypothetical protein